MRRVFALVTLLLVLTGCTAAPAPSPTLAAPAATTAANPSAPEASVAPAPDPVPQGPLTARVETQDYQVKFVLEGYTGATPPKITIRSITGDVYVNNLSASAEGVYTLETAYHKEVVVDQMIYTWNTPDGRTVTGELLYTNPLNAYQWQVTETEHLVIFHVGSLAAEEPALLEDAARRSSDLVGVPLPNPRIAIHMLPDMDSLKDLYRKLGVTPPETVSGFSYPGRMFMRSDMPVGERAIVVSHETVHTLGSFHNLLVLAEGLPQYAMMMEMAHLAKATGYQSERYQKWFDNLTQLIAIVQVPGHYNKVDLSRVPLMEPQDRNAYTVGGAFMLFVRSKYGDEGVRKLFALYRQDPDDISVLSKFFEESTIAVQNEFNLYLAREALRDANTVFGY